MSPNWLKNVPLHKQKNSSWFLINRTFIQKKKYFDFSPLHRLITFERKILTPQGLISGSFSSFMIFHEFFYAKKLSLRWPGPLGLRRSKTGRFVWWWKRQTHRCAKSGSTPGSLSRTEVWVWFYNRNPVFVSKNTRKITEWIYITFFVLRMRSDKLLTLFDYQHSSVPNCPYY